LISERQFDGRFKQPAFTYIDADLKGFEEWLWTRALHIKYGKTLSTARYRRPKRITYRLPTGRLTLEEHLTGSHQGHSDLTWSEAAYLRFRPDRSTRVGEWLPDHQNAAANPR
jgi:hypothetical protein